MRALNLRWLAPGALLVLLAPSMAAAAPEPPPVVAKAPIASRITGQILERGSAVAIVGAELVTANGELATTDAQGRFTVEVAPGDVALVVRAPGFEPFKLVEKMPPNTVRTVEYRLMPEAHARYRSTIRGASVPHEGERFTLREEELQQAPGAAGDPMRVIASLPGVLAPVPVLPIYVIRGGSPGMNGFFLDGMRVPELFHLVFVDGVVHPHMVSSIDFYPGSYDATFGRYASGIVDAQTRSGRSDAPMHGELELRLYDASALIEARLPAGATLIAAGRYGYPSPIIGLVQPGVDLNYWDYQLRVDWHGLTVEAIGAYDSLVISPAATGGGGNTNVQVLTTFHRIQIRERWRSGRLSVEAAIVGGLDQMAVFSGQGVEKLGLSARAAAHLRLSRFALSAGLDGELSRFSASNFTTDQNRAAPDELGDLAGNRDGVVAGGYAQAQLSLDDVLHRPASVTLGVRTDVYHANSVTLMGVDPRILARYAPQRWLEFFGGFGQYSQPPSFPVPLPGIDTFALQLGLQKSIQGSVGIRLNLPESVYATLTGYYGRFYNINDVVLDFSSAACTSAPPESISGLAAYVTRQVDGEGFGMELLLRRSLGTVTGWLAYTLSRSQRNYSCGLAPSDFDQTHVLNGVVQVKLPWRMVAGLKVAFSTGRPYTQLSVDLATLTVSGQRNNQRLPTYLQIDLRLDREWIFRRWALSIFLEVLNVTYSETIYGVTFPTDPVLMIPQYDMPQFQGFKWVLPSIGARGRF